MHEPTSSNASAQPVSVNGASERDITSVDQKTAQPLENNAEQIMAAVTRLTSSSIEDLRGLSTELEKLQEFLRFETERVQHEIDSAVAGAKIIIETIAPWRRLPPTTSQVSPNGSASQHTRQT
jgi:hypothetical protein